jgi:hypothetical protein
MGDMPAVAVDVGSGMTKATCGSQRVAFPSVGGPAIQGGHRLASDPYAEVEFGTTRLTVGEQAYGTVRPDDLPDSNTPEWFRSDVYLALLYAALARLLPADYSGRIALCTGLPIGYFDASREALIERLTGEHKFRVGAHTYRVTLRRPNVFVVPQVLGLYFWALENVPGIGGRRAGFIDVGTFTTGWAMVEGLQVLQWATGGAPIGVSKVREALATHLMSVWDCRPSRAGLDAALRSGAIAIGRGHESVAEFVREAAREAATSVRQQLRASWGPARDAAIYIGGGGADLFYPAICAEYPHARCLYPTPNATPTDNPIFTVVDGYARWMDHRLRLKASVA